MPIYSNVRKRILETLFTTHPFTKITGLSICIFCCQHNIFHERSFTSSPRSPNYGPRSAPQIRGHCVKIDDFDKNKHDSGGTREKGFLEFRRLGSDCNFDSKGGEKCDLDGLDNFSESEEEEENEVGENEVDYDELRALDSFDKNREKRQVNRIYEVDEEELRHPLVRETCRLISLRSAWTPNHESELKRLLRSLKPSQVCAVLRALPDERVSLKFFSWANRQWRYKHDPLVYYTMLKVLSKTKLCQGSKRVLRLMRRRKIELFPEDFGCVMVSFSRAGHLRKAMQMLTVMQRAGVDLDIFICNTAINVLVEGGKLEKALRFLVRMKLVGIEPNVVSYNCLIKGYCEGKRVEDAIKLIEDMPLKGCFPDKISYYTVIGFLSKEKRIDELRGLMEKMLTESKLLHDQVTYNTIIHTLCKYGHAEEALGFLREAEQKGLSIDKVGHTAIINSFCQEEKLDKAKELVNEMFSKGCNPDVVTYTAILNGFCRAGEVNQAKKLLQQMYKNGCKPNCVSYTALLNGLCLNGNSVEAREMVNMSEGWWSPNAVTYIVIMHGFRREGKLSEACDMIMEMIGKGFFPSPVEINLLIQSLCRKGETDKAKKLMEQCLKKGCAVNVVNFTTVIHGFCRNDDLDSALSVLDDIYLNNKHPDEVTYTVIIDALGRKGRIDEAIEMTKKLLHSGLLPTPVTYRSIIHHFCWHKRVDELLKLLEKMLLRQNFGAVYNQVIEKLCYLGNIDEAYKLLGKVLRTTSRSDVNTCHVLMKGFLKNKNPVGSYKVACRMFNRNMIPDLKICEEVSKQLIVEKKLDEADKLMLRFVERGHVSPDCKQPA